jgi:hypothetical protein
MEERKGREESRIGRIRSRGRRTREEEREERGSRRREKVLTANRNHHPLYFGAPRYQLAHKCRPGRYPPCGTSS